MENSPESALDAINEALGITDAIEDEETNADGQDAGEDGVAGEEPESDDSGDDEGEAADDADAEAEDDEGEGEEGEQTDEEKAAKAAAKSEFNADGTRKEKPGAKKPDPINDPIPKDLKQETSDRMRSLIKIAKEKEAEVAQVRGDFDTIINGIKASGASPEQYGEAISWLSLFNSPKVEDRRAAYDLVENVAERMATLLGIDRTTPDPFKNHPDLKTAVANKQITPELARETARHRDATAFKGSLEQGQRQQQLTAQQQKEESDKARADLNAFDVEMRGKDPLYDAKRKIIVPILQPIFKTLPKSQWAQTYKDAYARAKVQPKGIAAKGAKKPQLQPLRGNKQPAGGRVREPASALEAMNGALSSMK
jgi:hypothetical protein